MTLTTNQYLNGSSFDIFSDFTGLLSGSEVVWFSTPIISTFLFIMYLCVLYTKLNFNISLVGYLKNLNFSSKEFHVNFSQNFSNCVKLRITINYEPTNTKLMKNKSGMTITYLHFTQFFKYDAFSNLILRT